MDIFKMAEASMKMELQNIFAESIKGELESLKDVQLTEEDIKQVKKLALLAATAGLHTITC